MEEVAGVAALVAQRLDMDPQRILTLLSGRVGAVTKAVLPDKAIAIADVFSAAGVKVVVLPAAYQDASRGAADSAPAPEPEEAPAVARREEPREVSPEATAAPVPEPPSVRAVKPGPESGEDSEERPADEPDAELQGRDEWDRGGGWNVDDVLRLWGGRAPDATHGRSSHDDPDSHDGHDGHDAQDGHGRHDFHDVRGGHDSRRAAGASEDEALPGAEDDRPYPEHDPELEDEADRLGPRATDASTSPFTTSTRWVPSPHDEYGFDPDEVPIVPADEGGTSSRDDGRGFGAGRGGARGAARGPADGPVGARNSGFSNSGGAEAAYGHLLGDPPREGPRLRVFLMWGLIASIVVFLLLQFVMADRVRSGPPPSAFSVGLEAFRKGEFTSALRAWEPEAENGNAAAQYYLGYMAQNGLGQPWSNARAAGYYRRAAEAGLPEAQLALGDLYLRGMGVEQDEAQGAELYRRAAATGDAQGRFEYGKLLLHGKGVERDPRVALEQFQAAADAGLHVAADYVAFALEAVAADPEPEAPPQAPTP